MKIPEGYVLVKISELPGLIRESLRTVMKQKPVVFARSRIDHFGGSHYWEPLYNGQDESERVLREVGNNAAQAIALHGVDHDEGDGDAWAKASDLRLRRCVTCDHIEADHVGHGDKVLVEADHVGHGNKYCTRNLGSNSRCCCPAFNAGVER